MKMMPITMESDALSGMKSDFDLLITQAISSMQAWNSRKSVISLRLEIKLDKALVDDGQGGKRGVIMPQFEHKVNAVIQAKTELKGGTADEYELVWDELAKRYGMVRVSSNQTSLFEDAGGETGEADGNLLELEIEDVEEEAE